MLLSYRRIRRYSVCRLKRLEARDLSHVRFTNYFTSTDQLINWFGCPNLIYTRERIHLVAMLATDAELKKNLYRVCRFLAREEIAYRYPIMYEMIRKMFSPDDTNPPEACAMFMPDDETDDKEYAMAA